jgi:type IX secretion system PorP/SprF family membrane protein
MKSKFIIAICCFCIAFVTKAQEYTIYDQYYFHYYLMNPATAGAAPCTHFMVTNNQQWVGLADAPSTQTISFQTRTLGNLGIGAYLYNDKNGYSYQQGGQFTIAYHIPMSIGNRYTKAPTLDRQLSFAVSAKFYRYQLSNQVVNDANLQGENVQRKDGIYPNANFGVFFQDYKFFTGLSVTNLIPVKIDMFGDTEPLRPLTAFYQIGYAIPTTRDLDLEPSAVLSVDANSRRQLDLDFRAIQHLEDQDMSWWAGIIYRQNLDQGSGQSLMLIPNISAVFGKFRIGYAYELDLNGMITHNYGTHQIMLGYSFCSSHEFCR